MKDHNKIAVNTTHLYHKGLKACGILIAKSCTTSTTQVFRDNFNFKRVQEEKWDYNKFKDYYSFAFVRNPWDRLVSTYHNKVESDLEPCFKKHPEYNITRGMTFTSFIKQIQRISHPTEWWNVHIRPQWYSTCNWRQEIILDYIGRFENYIEDLHNIQRDIGLEPCFPRVANKTKKRKDYKFYYNDSTRDIVGKIYEKDIEIFKYNF